MRQPTRWIINHVALGLTAVGLSLALILGTARVVSDPSRGEELASRHALPRPAVIAHRGASHLAPESTRPAYLLGRELGADYLEMDLRRTRDRVLVVAHDRDLRRTTDVGTVFPDRAGAPVETFTFAELQRLDAGSWFNARDPARARPSFAGLSILRLEQVLAIAEGRSPPPGVYLELKDPRRYPGIEEQVILALRARGWLPAAGEEGRPAATPARGRPRVVFQSFHRESLERLQALAPHLPRVLLLSERSLAETPWDAVLRESAGVAMGIGTWGYRRAYGPSWSEAASAERYMTTWPSYTGQAHRAGLLVYPWTIDATWEMWMVRLGGADGLFTNRPGRAAAVFGRAPLVDLDAVWERIGY